MLKAWLVIFGGSRELKWDSFIKRKDRANKKSLSYWSFLYILLVDSTLLVHVAQCGCRQASDSFLCGLGVQTPLWYFFFVGMDWASSGWRPYSFHSVACVYHIGKLSEEERRRVRERGEEVNIHSASNREEGEALKEKKTAVEGPPPLLRAEHWNETSAEQSTIYDCLVPPQT